MRLELETDAWADGQVGSKLWLCEVLEKLPPVWPASPSIVILGGWYAQTAFLLFSRDRLHPSKIVSIDADPECAQRAMLVNNHWAMKRQFNAITHDANALSRLHWDKYKPDIVINTAIEHFERQEWYEYIPVGVTVVLQGTDMWDGDHHGTVFSTNDLEKYHPMKQIIYRGEKHFSYPDKKFTRFMVIGVK